MASYTDNFTRGDQTGMGGNWSQPNGTTIDIVSNAAKQTSGTSCLARYDEDLATVDHFCQATVNYASGSAHYQGVAVRMSSGASPTYYLGAWADDVQEYRIYRYDGTGEDVIGTSTGYSTPTSPTLKLSATGSGATVTLQLRVDDVLAIDTTDTSADRLVSGVRVGLGNYSSVAGVVWDSFSAEDISSGTTHAATASFSTSATCVAAASVGKLATLRPNGDGTFSNWTGGYANIDDDPDTPNESDVAGNTGGVDGYGFYGLEAAPSDMATATTVSVKVRSRGTAGATVDLYARMYDNTEAVALTSEVLVKRHTTADWSTDQVWLPITTTIDKATLETARLRLRADVI